jgi:hypothetical protein
VAAGADLSNPYLGTCSADDARRYLNENGVASISLAEGETLDLP